MARLRPIAGLAVAAALLAAACSGTAPRKPPPRPLRILMGGDVATLDPQIPFDEISSTVLGNVFETLVEFDATFRLSAGLASRWINPDDRTWRFILKPGVRFSDGSPLKSSDVKFSIERLKSLSGSQIQAYTRHIASVDVVDEATVDVHTDTPVAILNSLAFIPILSQRQVQAVGKGVGEHPMGTGPYRVTSWQKGRAILLEVNPHHKPLPEIQRVEFTIREDVELLEELVRSRPDLTLYLRRSLLDQFRRRKTPDLDIVSSDGLAVWYMAFSLKPRLAGLAGPNPMSDVRVRRALALGTDREPIARDGLGGFARPIAQLVVPQVFGFDPDIQLAMPDVEAARLALARAGYSGAELPLFTATNASPRLPNMIAEQWSRLGVRATVRALPPAEMDKALESGDFTAALQGYGCTSGDASEMLTFALQTRDPARGYGPGNYAGYSNPEVDRIAESNLRVFDARSRLAQLRKAFRIAAEDVPYLPLCSVQDLYVVSRAVRWTPRVDGDLRVAEIGFRSLSADDH